MAQDTIDVLSRRDGTKPAHPTQSLPLQGSAGWPVMQRELAHKGASLGLAPETVEHLGYSYGTNAQVVLDLIEGDVTLAARLINDLPYIKAEVTYACRYEMAMTPYDILARRMSIILEDRQSGLGILDEVATLMAQELNWSTAQQQSLIEAYRNTIHEQKNVVKMSQTM